MTRSRDTKPRPSRRTIELVADLLAATNLVPQETLAAARGRARQTRSLATALARLHEHAAA